VGRGVIDWPAVRDLARLPKAHLHVHLENAVRWTTLVEIAGANGVDVPAHLLDGHYAFTGFGDFFEQNALVRHCLVRPDDFRRIAYEFCADEAASGVRYAEVSFSACAHGDRVGDDEMPLAAVLDGLAEGAAAFGIECGVVLDHSRRRPVERAWRTLRLAERHRAGGVVAIGLAGAEAHPAEPFADVFRAARDAGLHRVPHAGEALGAASIRAAIDTLDAERLGHGIRVLDDASLVTEVRERGIALEVCPSSNVALGFSPSLAEHPLSRLVDAGLAVTLNTDIPAMLNLTLVGEYAHARDMFGFDDATLAALARAGFDASFADGGRKAAWRGEIDGWLAADDAR
jgi:adenosine deaminase